MAYYVYVLKCKDGSFYTGMTRDIKKRLKEHEDGLNPFTKNRKPLKLVFFCCFPNKSVAARFEKYLKSHSGAAFRQKHLV